MDARTGTKLAEKLILENDIFLYKKIPFHDNNMRSLFKALGRGGVIIRQLILEAQRRG